MERSSKYRKLKTIRNIVIIVVILFFAGLIGYNFIHFYDVTTTEPTCTEAGYDLHVCKICKKEYTDNIVDPLGHDYQSTKTEDTVTRITCKRCGEGLYSYADSSPEVSLNAKSAFIYSLSDKQFIYYKNETSIIYPASTTKIMTAWLSGDYLNDSDQVIVGDEINMIGENSSRSKIKKGDNLTYYDMLRALILPSGNDTAYTIARACGEEIYQNENPNIEVSQTIEENVVTFVNAMNARADEIGMLNTNFTCPDGYMDEDHYTTVEDMLTLMLSVRKYEKITKLLGESEYECTSLNGNEYKWVTVNNLINPLSRYENDAAKWGKTGNLVGYSNIVFDGEINGKEYIIGVYGSKSIKTKYEDAIKLINLLAG